MYQITQRVVSYRIKSQSKQKGSYFYKELQIMEV
jgi:hypothetical protein